MSTYGVRRREGGRQHCSTGAEPLRLRRCPRVEGAERRRRRRDALTPATHTSTAARQRYKALPLPALLQLLSIVEQCLADYDSQNKQNTADSKSNKSSVDWLSDQLGMTSLGKQLAPDTLSLRSTIVYVDLNE
ncbi:hypothetical protein J6590_010812 [Homalodisca vitripennis]|nr:hypothetical protein J6590_010812 [Homalodisca vitripennis]